ncbi:class I SAM-dependent methyltransferase [Aestuariispira ectoiniformans]|uniref:class I SAM-dependent methyltransferase n=1 Tax=Aestuariispira ectoiniformans TaxID=2775080 RepID=UPI00223A7C1A|nr:class I SAM-dependent methyltransferase [Aestuariispira ectoiniformans]
MNTINGRMRCPYCHTQLQGTYGAVQCPTHGEFKRNSEGIYLFLQDKSGYFDEHWQQNRIPDIPTAKKETAHRFLTFLLKSASSKSGGGCWLDVGTGDGVHLALSKEANPELDLIGLDISQSGLCTVAQRVPGATLLHADGQSIPLQDDTVDACFSYGVLAYMEDPWKGLSEMVRVTRPGGIIGVWFYPRKNDAFGLIFRLVRSMVTRLPAFLQSRVADLIVPFLSLLPTASGISLSNASWASCREVVLVNIAPPSLIFPTQDEICERFIGLGCQVVSSDEDEPISVWAKKP